MKKLLLAVMLSVLASSVFAEAFWKEAVDGDWSDGSKWSTMDPPLADEQANIDANANAYTVTVSSAQSALGLSLSGNTASSYKTKLDINAPLTLDGGRLVVGYSHVSIGPGGVLEVKNASNACSIGLGGKIELNGGTLVMTNSAKTLYVGNSAYLGGNHPAFIMNSGHAYFKGSSIMLQASSGNYSKFELNGGVLEFIDSSSRHNSAMMTLELNSDSGKIFSMGGDAEIRLPTGGNLNFGRGIFDIGGNAKIDVTSVGDYNSIVIASASSDKGRTTTFNFADNASLEATGLKYFIFGKGDMRATGTRGFFNLSGGTIKLGYHSELGTGQGIWEMKQTGGNIEFARYGVRIGGIPANVTRQTDGADLCCTSTVTVAGGTFNCSAENNHGDTPNQSMYGFVVGAGLVGKTYAHLMNGWTDGRFVVSNDAVVTIGNCTKVIGVGKAVGSVFQDGGTVTGSGIESVYHESRDSLTIGAFGGEGSYHLHSGTATFDCPLYVGGVSTNLLQRTDAGLPADTEGKAQGKLLVDGGTMSFSRNSYVGFDGAGTIELANAGSLTFAKNLTLTNRVEGSASTIKITMNATSAPTFKVNAALVVGAGAKLVVDATNFTGLNAVKIVDCAARIGDFASENITLTQTGSDLSVRQDSNGSIYLVRKLPLLIMIK